MIPSSAGASIVCARLTPQCRNVVGDRQNGQLYLLDPNNPTDNGAFIERRRGWPHFMADGSRASVSNAQH